MKVLSLAHEVFLQERGSKDLNPSLSKFSQNVSLFFFFGYHRQCCKAVLLQENELVVQRDSTIGKKNVLTLRLMGKSVATWRRFQQKLCRKRLFRDFPRTQRFSAYA